MEAKAWVLVDADGKIFDGLDSKFGSIREATLFRNKSQAVKYRNVSTRLRLFSLKTTKPKQIKISY